MTARIYRPAKSATQSGLGRTRRWVLEYGPTSARTIEPLMGWTGSRDMESQVRLTFATKDEAIDYCVRNSVAYQVEEPAPFGFRTVSYSDNFRPGRPRPWTH